MLTVLLLFLSANNCDPIAVHSEQVPYAVESIIDICGWPNPVKLDNRAVFHMSNAARFYLRSDSAKAKQHLATRKTGDHKGRTGVQAAAGIADRVSPLVSMYYFMQVNERHWLVLLSEYTDVLFVSGVERL